jgi:hypothetical protein
MKKNLRSVEKLSTGAYEYLRIDAEEAVALVDAKSHIYISKEEYKRQSKFYHLQPCKGTLKNVIDADGAKAQKIINGINYYKHLNQRVPNSTKIANCSMGVSEIRRTNKYALKHIKKVKQNAILEE